MRKADYECGGVKLYLGDCLEILPTLEAGSVDAVITDPPYGINIARWDSSMPPQQVLDECLRIACGPVLWFGGRQPEEIFAFGDYRPQPERLLIWYTPFSLGWTTTNGIFHKWHPIWCWRLPKKSTLKRDVLAVNTEGHHDWGSHPCAKPVDLMKQLADAFGGSGTLDPFMGSGTTGVACVRTGHEFIGIEISEEYFAIAKRRIETAQAQLTLAL